MKPTMVRAAILSAIAATAVPASGEILFTFSANKIYTQTSAFVVNFSGGVFNANLRDGNFTYSGCAGANPGPMLQGPNLACPTGTTGYVIEGDYNNDGIRDSFGFWAIEEIQQALLVAPFQPTLPQLYSAPPSMLPRPLGGWRDQGALVYYNVLTTDVYEYPITWYDFNRSYQAGPGGRSQMKDEIVAGQYKFTFPLLQDPVLPATIAVNHVKLPEGTDPQDRFPENGFRFTSGTYSGGFYLIDPASFHQITWTGNNLSNTYPAVDEYRLSIRTLSNTYADYALATFPLGSASRPNDDFDGDGFSNVVEYGRGTDPTNAADFPVEPVAQQAILDDTVSFTVNKLANAALDYSILVSTTGIGGPYRRITDINQDWVITETNTTYQVTTVDAVDAADVPDYFAIVDVRPSSILDSSGEVVFPPSGFPLRLPTALEQTYTLPPDFFDAGDTGVLQLRMDRTLGTSSIAFDTSTNIYNVAVRFVDTYAGFALRAFPAGSDSRLWVANADFDGDGFSNIVEFAMQTNPDSVTSFPGVLAPVNDGGVVSFKITKRPDAVVNYSISVSYMGGTPVKITSKNPDWDIIETANEYEVRTKVAVIPPDALGDYTATVGASEAFLR